MNSPAVLLLPGTLCTSAVFDHQVKALEAAGIEVNSVEFRRERSIEEMAHAAATQIPDGKPAAVAGFSMGGMVAITLASLYPEKVDRLALLNSNIHPERPERRDNRLKYLAMAAKTSLRQVLQEGFLANYLLHMDPRHCQLILDMADEHGLDTFEAQTTALASRPDSGPLLAGVRKHVLIVGARQDVLCPPASQMDMLHQAHDGQLVMLDDCGHFSLLEKPGEVNRALLDWCRT